MHNVVIIGSGCAGLTAAIYAARANLKPLVIDGHEPGGQLSLTTHVENYPGFPDGVMGPELIENMRKQAKKFGAEFRAGVVTEVNLHKRPFKIIAGKDTYEARSLIVAAGASARLLGLKGERELIGHGVSTCATCDGYFFRGKPIAVIGGGDSAMEEANFLSRYASKVHLVHRRNDFRASKIMIDRARVNEKVEFVTPFVVEEIVAPQGHVEGVNLRNPQTRETREIPLDGVFVAIGHDPNTIIFKGKLEMDANGYLLAKHGSLTSIPGVFVAGDVQDHRYRDAYLEIFERIAEERLHANVSGKLTQHGLDINVEFCEGLLRSIVERAASFENFLRVDMEGSAYTQRTIDLVKRVRTRNPAVGTVIQSYLYRSETDVADLLSCGCRIRLCKGAYKESEEVAFPRKEDVDANFVRLMQVLLSSGFYHAIATHDPRMIAATIRFAAAKQISKDDFEFQMLYGVRTDLQRQLFKDGYRVRVYIPYGKDWFPYFMRGLAERPANLVFFLRNLLRS